MKKIFPLLLMCLLWFGCDPRYDIYYFIDNQSDNQLTIVRIQQYINQDQGTINNVPQDTSLIAAKTQLLFNHQSGFGYTRDKVQSIDSIAPHIILNQDSVRFKRNVASLENWDVQCGRSRNCEGIFTLTITNEDFQ